MGLPMYLCLCNGLTEKRVRSALAEHPEPSRTSDAYRACGCTALCGACAAAMTEAVRSEKSRRGCNRPFGAD
jgi:bacterioferritin-associated ferredoxin